MRKIIKSSFNFVWKTNKNKISARSQFRSVWYYSMPNSILYIFSARLNFLFHILFALLFGIYSLL